MDSTVRSFGRQSLLYDRYFNLFVLDHSQQYSRHSGRYTVEDIYTVTDIQPDIQYQVRTHIHSGRYTEVVQDTQHDIHGGGYTAADTQHRIHSG